VYCFTHQPCQSAQVSGQLHDPAALGPKKETSPPVDGRLGEA